MALEVSGKSISVQAFGPERITSLADYLTALELISQSGLPSADLKSAYRTRTDEFFKSGAMITGNDIEPLLGAQKRALVTIARTEANEKGLPAPSDKVLARRIAEAIDRASRNRTAWLAPGNEVEVTTLGTTQGMFVADKHLEARRAGEKGKLLQWVPGHGGDVWAVQHADGKVAVYSIDEMTPVKPAKTRDGKAWIG